MLGKLSVAVVTCALATVSCQGGDVDTASGSVSLSGSLGGVQAEIFDKSCSTVACHRGSSPAGGLTLEPGKAHDALVDVPALMAPGKRLVVPGHPDHSFLMEKLRGHLSQDEGLPMPYAKPPLSAAQIGLVEQWIAGGATAD